MHAEIHHQGASARQHASAPVGSASVSRLFGFAIWHGNSKPCRKMSQGAISALLVSNGQTGNAKPDRRYIS